MCTHEVFGVFVCGTIFQIILWCIDIRKVIRSYDFIDLNRKSCLEKKPYELKLKFAWFFFSWVYSKFKKKLFHLVTDSLTTAHSRNLLKPPYPFLLRLHASFAAFPKVFYLYCGVFRYTQCVAFCTYAIITSIGFVFSKCIDISVVFYCSAVVCTTK